LFLAYHGPTPVARATLTVIGPLGRLRGAGVLPDYRRKGVYSNLVATRCRLALEQGAEIAVAHGRVDTSGPILKARGFERAGDYVYYQLEPESSRS
jgi:predicted GNAT family acetyltransferase